MPYQNLMLTLCLATDDGPFSPRPLTLSEWCYLKSILLSKNIPPKTLFDKNEEELCALLGCSRHFGKQMASLFSRRVPLEYSLAHFEAQNITLLTYEHPAFPLALKSKLGAQCPPILCAKGDLSLLQTEKIGLVSSRLVSEDDQAFVFAVLPSVVRRHKILVMGGISGMMGSIREKIKTLHGKFIVVMGNSLSQTSGHQPPRLTDPAGGLLLSLPPFGKGSFEERAILRNLILMSLSEAALVVKAEDGKGSTFLSAEQSIAKELCPIHCQRVNHYGGNTKLIHLGATPTTVKNFFLS